MGHGDDAGALDLDGRALAVGQRGAVDLGGRGRRQRHPLEAGEERLRRRAQLLLDDGLRLLVRERRAVLCSFSSSVAPFGRQRLARLAIIWPTLT